jgi:nucleotide-binding universal stress UspA family protein
MKKIMIALDYGNAALRVAETGFEFAKAMNAEICLVHAIPDISYYSMEYSQLAGFEDFGPADSFKTMAEQQSEARLFLGAVAKHLGDKYIKIKVVEGAYYDSLLEYATEYDADLIVMGSRGRHGLDRLIMGDIVSKVIQHARTRVLIVPADKTYLQQIVSRATESIYMNIPG